MPAGRARLFVSYSRKDRKFLERFLVALKAYEHLERLEEWHDRKLVPGDPWDTEIRRRMEHADVIVLLLTMDFLASDYIRKVEGPLALRLHETGAVRVVPVLVGACEAGRSPFAHLTFTNSDPITGERDRDAAWVRVAAEIARAAEGAEARQSAAPRTLVPCSLRPAELHPVGRERKIEDVLASLTRRHPVAITGFPGIGKSTVFAHALERLIASDQNPYAEIHCDRLHDGEDVREQQTFLLKRLLRRLRPEARVEPTDLASLRGLVDECVRGEAVLLAVDSVDSSAGQAAVMAISEATSDITVAVTSCLRTWEGITSVSIGELDLASASELYRRIHPGTWSDPDVRKVCERAGFHPLWIAQDASEARSMGLSPADIHRGPRNHLRRISERIPERLRALIGLLQNPTVQVELADEAADIGLADLEELHARHLICLYRDGRSFAAHNLIREECRRCLEDLAPAIVDDVAVRTARFYVRFLDDRQGGDEAALREIDDEWRNIVALLDLVEDHRVIVDLAVASVGDHHDDPNGYVPRRYETGELYARRSRLLEAARAVGGLQAARVEKNIGLFTYWRGNHVEAQDCFLRALERYEREGDVPGIAATTWLVGYIEGDENFYVRQANRYRHGLSLVEQLVPRDPELLATGHHLLGCNHYHRGELAAARETFMLARQLAFDLGAKHLSSRITRRLGYVDLALGSRSSRWLEGAAQTLMAQREVCQLLGRPRDVARIDRHLGLYHLAKGDLDAAKERFAAALEAFEHQEAQRHIGSIRRNQATLSRHAGDLARAESLCKESLEIAWDHRSLYGRGAGLEELARILDAAAADGPEICQQLVIASRIYRAIGHARAADLERRLAGHAPPDPPLPARMAGVLIDLVDTLAHSDHEFYNRKNARHAELLGVSTERFELAWKKLRVQSSLGRYRTTEGRVRAVAEELGVPEPRPRELREMVRLEEEMWSTRVEFDDGAAQLLRWFGDQGWKVAVVCNGPVALEAIDDSLGLTREFGVELVLSCACGCMKPEAEIYQLACLKLGLEAEECIYVGDGNDQELDKAFDLGFFTIKLERPTDEPVAGFAVDPRNHSYAWHRSVRSIDELSELLQRTARSPEV